MDGASVTQIVFFLGLFGMMLLFILGVVRIVAGLAKVVLYLVGLSMVFVIVSMVLILVQEGVGAVEETVDGWMFEEEAVAVATAVGGHPVLASVLVVAMGALAWRLMRGRRAGMGRRRPWQLGERLRQITGPGGWFRRGPTDEELGRINHSPEYYEEMELDDLLTGGGSVDASVCETPSSPRYVMRERTVERTVEVYDEEAMGDELRWE